MSMCEVQLCSICTEEEIETRQNVNWQGVKANDEGRVPALSHLGLMSNLGIDTELFRLKVTSLGKSCKADVGAEACN